MADCEAAKAELRAETEQRQKMEEDFAEVLHELVEQVQVGVASVRGSAAAASFATPAIRSRST